MYAWKMKKTRNILPNEIVCLARVGQTGICEHGHRITDSVAIAQLR
jgi:hypothetical protein